MSTTQQPTETTVKRKKACQTCSRAKKACVITAENGICQRCEKNNVECIFEELASSSKKRKKNIVVTEQKQQQTKVEAFEDTTTTAPSANELHSKPAVKTSKPPAACSACRRAHKCCIPIDNVVGCKRCSGKKLKCSHISEGNTNTEKNTTDNNINILIGHLISSGGDQPSDNDIVNNDDIHKIFNEIVPNLLKPITNDWKELLVEYFKNCEESDELLKRIIESIPKQRK